MNAAVLKALISACITPACMNVNTAMQITAKIPYYQIMRNMILILRCFAAVSGKKIKITDRKVKSLIDSQLGFGDI